MITGTNQRTVSEGGEYTPYVGLEAASVIMVNPKNEDYERITGRKLNYELKYDPYKNEDGSLSFPYRFLTHSKEVGYHFAEFNVSNADEVSSKGNTRFIDIKGSSTWGASLEALAVNEKMAWFNSSKARVAKKGEVGILNFLTTLLRYDSRVEGSQIMKDLADSYKITTFDKPETVAGINKLLKDYKDQTIALFYVVKKTKDNKFYQEINTRNDTFFVTNPDGSFSSKCIWRIKRIEEDCKKNSISFVKEDRLYVLDDVQKLPESLKTKVDPLPFDNDNSSGADW